MTRWTVTFDPNVPSVHLGDDTRVYGDSEDASGGGGGGGGDEGRGDTIQC